jgi:hypothetical protein
MDSPMRANRQARVSRMKAPHPFAFTVLREASMPADKLTLLSQSIRKSLRDLAESEGERKGGYSSFIDLRTTAVKLPAFLYCGGIHNGVNKIDLIGVATLGLSRTREIVDQVFGDSSRVRISRVDWCVDLCGISALDLALHCRLSRTKNCSMERSSTGFSYYPQRSKQRTVIFYDKRQQLRWKKDPLGAIDDEWTRVEVQLKGKGLPYHNFKNIHKYAGIDLLPNILFWSFGRKREGLTPRESLAAEGLIRKIQELGMQMASKTFTAQQWAHICKKYLEPPAEGDFPDLNRLMRKSIRDWLEDRIRFTRLKEEA